MTIFPDESPTSHEEENNDIEFRVKITTARPTYVMAETIGFT
jgi:hypothetical protein